MRIGGLQKLTLLDFPGKVACTLFLQGCNFRCPFCHNTPLLNDMPQIPSDELMSFLQKRKGMLDGVAITGGEPLINDDIAPLLIKIKELGYAVKLDTNGSFPDRLRALVEDGLVDYVAMDIKNCRTKYEQTAGAKDILSSVERSVRYLLDGHVDYEFRTTVVNEFHEPEDFHDIGQWISGAKAYFLQNFVDSGQVLCSGLSAPSKQKLENCRKISGQYISNTQIRGL